MMDDLEDVDFVSTPPDLAVVAKKAESELLPEISKKKYLQSYQNFMDWLKVHKAPISENVMLCYFMELSANMKPSSLWSIHSRLKSTIRLYKNINIDEYSKVNSFLKRKNEGFEPKTAHLLTEDQVKTFIEVAPNEVYLATKVILIFGLMGALRMAEMVNVKMSDLEEHGSDLLLVKIPTTKNKQQKSFTIQGGYLKIVKEYMALHPRYVKTDRFFLNYQRQKCTMQPIGINKLRNIPRLIAEYLKLPNSEKYTGHCFRRTSTTILANAGANSATIKRHGRWKSDMIADRYIEDSINYKKNTANILISAISNTISNERKMESVPFIDSNNMNVNNISVPKNDNSQVIESVSFTDSSNINVNNISVPDIENTQLSTYIMEEEYLVHDEVNESQTFGKFKYKQPIIYKFKSCTVNINNN